MTHNPDARCPACGADNDCAIAAGKPITACWCRGVRLAGSAIDALPDRLRGQRCLCRDCATRVDDEGVRSER